MGLPWGHRDEFGRRVGLNYYNQNASVQYADLSLLARYMQVSSNVGVHNCGGCTLFLMNSVELFGDRFSWQFSHLEIGPMRIETNRHQRHLRISSVALRHFRISP